MTSPLIACSAVRCSAQTWLNTKARRSANIVPSCFKDPAASLPVTGAGVAATTVGGCAGSKPLCFTAQLWQAYSSFCCLAGLWPCAG